MAFKTEEYIDYPETNVIVDPAANTQRLYFKTDHKLYHRNSAGAETEVSGGGSGGTSVTSETTDATEESLFTVTLTDDTVSTIQVIITAVQSDGTKRLSSVIVYSAYRDGAGAVELVGNNILSSNAWDAAVFQKCEFDVSGNDIRFRIKGVAATTLKWKALYNEVTQAGA